MLKRVTAYSRMDTLHFKLALKFTPFPPCSLFFIQRMKKIHTFCCFSFDEWKLLPIGPACLFKPTRLLETYYLEQIIVTWYNSQDFILEKETSKDPKFQNCKIVILESWNWPKNAPNIWVTCRSFRWWGVVNYTGATIAFSK